MKNSAVIETKYGYLVKDYDVAKKILSNKSLFQAGLEWKNFFNDPYAEELFEYLKNIFIFLDGEDHDKLRKTVLPLFSKNKTEEHLTIGYTIIKNVLDKIENKKSFDFNSQISEKYFSNFIATILGIPLDKFDELIYLSNMGTDIIGLNFTRSFKETFESIQKLKKILNEIIEAKRNKLDESIISILCKDQTLCNDDIEQILVLLLVAGYTTSSAQLSFVMYRILNDISIYKSIEKDLNTIDSIVEETFFLHTAIRNIAKKTSEDVFIDNFLFKKNTLVLIDIQGINKKQFKNNPQNKSYISFGFGAHSCIGMHMAKSQIALVIKTIFESVKDLKINGDVFFSKESSVFNKIAEFPVECDNIYIRNIDKN
jgi:cytochrome P450